MVPANIHDFFFASAGVAGALIGLLFVAISVAGERLARAEAGTQVHRIRAYAALVAFTNALAVSLFSLIPGQKIGWTTVSVGIVGLLFIAASLVSLLRVRPFRWSTARDCTFLAGLAVVFSYQVAAGLDVAAHPGDAGSVSTIAILLVASFLVGVSRAWELVGGPSFGFGHEIFRLVRGEELVEGTPGARPAGEAGAAREAGTREARTREAGTREAGQE